MALAAIIPAAFYILYIMAFDHHKPEPLKVLFLSALLGAVAACVVILTGLPQSLADSQMAESHGWKDSLYIGFLGLALPAELTKWLFLCVFLSLNKYYDEYFDGIVYSVCLSMGFAGVWCVWYMSDVAAIPSLSFFESTGLIFFILVPIHLMASVVMGYFLALERRKRRIVNHLYALFCPILIDGVLCSLVAVIGNRWEYYFFMAIVFSVLGMLAYSQIFHLLRLDGVSSE